jgi:hypothetical protein
MSHPLRWLLVLAGLSLLVLPAGAQTVVTHPVPLRTPGEAARLREAITRDRLQREELSRRIQAVVEQSGKVVAGLSAQAATMRDANLRLELDQRLAQAKSELQIELLRVQAQFARENGRTRQAQDLEAQIAAATAPRVTNASMRPEPATTSARPATGGAR